MRFSSFSGTAAFQFAANINLRFGAGTSASLPSELKALNVKRPFVVLDPGLKTNGAVSAILDNVASSGLAFEPFSEVEPNPRDSTVHRAFEAAKRADADGFVGIGGGSAMDAAKGIALLTTNPGPITDYDGINKVAHALPPVIAMPTTAGTGSEVTANIALTNSSTHYKMSVRSPRLLPALAILDPLLLATLPKHVAAASGMDALTHAIEGYLSLRASPMSDVLALEAMRLVGRNLRAFVANPENLEASSAMLMGSMLAGLVISNTGTGNDHAIARALGGLCDTPHGLATAMLLAPVMRFNASARPARYRDIARAIGLDVNGSERDIAQRACDEIAALQLELGIPSRLREIGVTEAHIPDLVRVALKNVGPNPRRTDAKDLEALLASML